MKISRKIVGGIETIVKTAIIGAALIGVLNEFYIKDKFLEKYTRDMCMNGIIPYMIINEYKRIKNQKDFSP